MHRCGSTQTFPWGKGDRRAAVVDEGCRTGKKAEMNMKREILIERSQELRKHATPEEKKLWYQYLKKYPIQWNRQKVLGSFIVDFYCKKAKLVIEIDGSQHYEENTMDYDRRRTKYLNELGLEVIRFTNTDISRRFRNVCDGVDAAVKQRLNEMDGN